ncbi:MAG: hypothetical protein ISS25_03410 [Nanoarchaeota archaeon]|nr:hypothetical protein [DPANN group archaeon]MBL7116849.1 hypothetical protein [Nanoarchaeota archaeon]
MKSQIKFAEKKLKKALTKLKNSKTEEKELYKWINTAMDHIEENAFCGFQIAKRLIPKDYEKKFGRIDNLWKYNLPNAWRLIYTIKKEEIVILSIILEWLPHKEYKKRFRY